MSESDTLPGEPRENSTDVTPDDDGSQDTFQVGEVTYKSREEVQQALLEKEEAVRRFQSKADKLEQEVKHLSQQADLKPLLEQIAVMRSGQDAEKESELSIEEIEAKWREDAGVGARYAAAWARDAEEKAKKHAEEKIGEVAKELRALREALDLQAPEVTANPELIESLRAEGLSVKQAVGVLRKTREFYKIPDDNTERETAPGNMGTSRAAGQRSVVPVDPEALALIEKMIPGGLRKHERARLEKGLRNAN